MVFMFKKITIVSPHIDDAVFSLWGMIYFWIEKWLNIEIITVFSKTNYMWPHDGIGDINKCMLIRKNEDKDVLSKLWEKLKFTYLDYKEALLRWYEFEELFWTIKSFDSLLIKWLQKDIKSLTKNSDYIFIPYWYWNHVDHQVCSKLKLDDDRTFFYSDIPYICYWETDIKEWLNYKLDDRYYKKHIELSNCYNSQMYLDIEDNYVLDYLKKNWYTFYWKNKKYLDKIILLGLEKNMSNTKIPKRIIYCWFGKKEKNDLMKDCIASWHKLLPDYEIIEFNEKNGPMDHPFVKRMYKEKNWSFLSDYVRLWALYNYWWIYLDTDMEVLKPLDDLLNDECFLWFELAGYSELGAGILGAGKWNKFLKEVLDYYDNIDLDDYTPETIWDILKKVLENKYKVKLENKNQTIDWVRLYTKEYFYPYYYGQTFHRKKDIKENTYVVHHWNNSWWYTRKENKKISIIIPHLNEWYYLNIMLDSFYNYINYDNYEIIICDDGSDNLKDLDFIEHHFLKDKIKLYKNKWLWAPWGRNFWASKASWELLVFLDSHMYVNTDILEKINEIFLNYSYISLLQLTIWSIADKKLRWEIYKIKDFLLDSTWDYSNSKFNLVETPNIAWWATVVKKEVFDNLWWFNQNFRKWWAEDLEFSMRAWLSWYRCYLLKDTVIMHYFKESFKNTVIKLEDVLFNKIVFAITCFQNENRLVRIFDELEEYYWKEMFEKIYDEVFYLEDIDKLRINQVDKFVYDDDRYFEKFKQYYDQTLLNC